MDDLKQQLPTVTQAITSVMRDVGAVGKDRVNKAQDYKFRGIDDFFDAVHPALVANGVVVMPFVEREEHDYAERLTNAGKASYTTHVWLTVRFDFYGPAGDMVSCRTIGEAADTADKAANKAMSAAMKYALMQALCIPLKDMADGDADTPDMGSKSRPSAAPVEFVEDETVRVRREALRAELATQPTDVKAAMAAWCKANHVSLTKPCSERQVTEADAEFERICNEVTAA